MMLQSLKFQASLKILHELEFDETKLLAFIENRQIYWDLSSLLIKLVLQIREEFENCSLCDIFNREAVTEEDLSYLCQQFAQLRASDDLHLLPEETIRKIIKATFLEGTIDRQIIDVGHLLDSCVRFGCFKEIVIVWNGLDEWEQSKIADSGGPTRRIALFIVNRVYLENLKDIDFPILMGAFQETPSPFFLQLCCNKNLQLTHEYLVGKKKNGFNKSFNSTPQSSMFSKIEIRDPCLWRDMVKIVPTNLLQTLIERNPDMTSNCIGLWIELWPNLSSNIRKSFLERLKSSGILSQTVKYLCHAAKSPEFEGRVLTFIDEIILSSNPKNTSFVSSLFIGAVRSGCDAILDKLSILYPWELLESWKVIERGLVSDFNVRTAISLVSILQSKSKHFEDYNCNNLSPTCSTGSNSLFHDRIGKFLTDLIPKLNRLSVTPNILKHLTDNILDPDLKTEFIIESFDSAVDGRCHHSAFSWLWCHVSEKVRSNVKQTIQDYFLMLANDSFPEFEFRSWPKEFFHVVTTQESSSFLETLRKSKLIQNLNLAQITWINLNVSYLVWTALLQNKAKNRLIQDFRAAVKSIQLARMFQAADSLRKLINILKNISYYFFEDQKLQMSFWKQFFSLDVLSDFAISFQGTGEELRLELECLCETTPNYELFKWAVDAVPNFCTAVPVTGPVEPWHGARADRLAFCEILLALITDKCCGSLINFADWLIADLGWTRIALFLATPIGANYVGLFDGKRRFSLPTTLSLMDLNSFSLHSVRPESE